MYRLEKELKFPFGKYPKLIRVGESVIFNSGGKLYDVNGKFLTAEDNGYTVANNQAIFVSKKYNDEYVICCYDILEKEFSKKLVGYSSITRSSMSNLFIISKLNQKIQSRFIYDFEKNVIIGQIDEETYTYERWKNNQTRISYIYIPNYCYTKDKITLSCKKLNIEKLKQIEDIPIQWQVDISQFGGYLPEPYVDQFPNRKDKLVKIRTIYGVANGLVLIGLNNGKIIGLDVETGELDRSWWKIERCIQSYYPYIGSYTAKLDELAGEIVGVQDRGIFIIDSAKDNIIYHTPSIMKKHRMNMATQRTNFDAHHVYAMGKREIIDDNYEAFLIAINRSTGIIDWLYILPELNEKSYGPIVAGNKLYFILNDKLMTFVRE